MNVSSPDLSDTPRRVVKAWGEMLGGYHEDVDALLRQRFKEPSDGMVVVSGIRFWSMCEHHLLPFTGVATVGYIPCGEVVGLSKLPRLVHAFARRLQLQERLTRQVAETINRNVVNQGVACIITGQHLCMQMRGIKDDGHMTSSFLRGAFREDASARSEFLALHSDGQK